MFRVILCFLIILTLVSCGKNELMDLSGFIHNYNNISETDLKLTDFIVKIDEDTVYTAVLCEDDCNILLSVCSGSDNKVKSCKIALIKNDGSVPTDQQVKMLYAEIIDVMSAFCNFTTQQSQEIAESFELSKTETLSKIGELTLRKDNYYFVYYSTQIISQFTVYNAYVEEIESTHKPESKPYFGEDFIIKDKETP